MIRSVQFAIFGVFFFSMFLLLSYLLFWSSSFLFIIPRGWQFWGLVLLSTIGYVSMAAAMVSRGLWARIVSFAGSVWLGVSVEALVVLLPCDLIRRFIPIDPQSAAIAVLIVITVLTVSSIVAWLILRRKTIELPVSKLTRALRVVQLSDLHMGASRGTNYLERVISATNSLEPEAILITGDLADDERFYATGSVHVYDAFKAPVFMSMGNHEDYGAYRPDAQFPNAKIRVLRNEYVDLGDYQLIGIDYGYSAGDVGKLLSGLKYDRSKYTILMNHAPVGLEEASQQGVDLMLSGHTHQGQFFPFNFLVRLVYRRGGGLYRHGSTTLYTSPGTGTWGPPLRFGSFNEVTLFVLRPSKDSR